MHQRTTVAATERRHLIGIIDGLVEGIILLNTRRQIVWANDTALAMHGVSELAGLGGTVAAYRKRFALRGQGGRLVLLRGEAKVHDLLLASQARFAAGRPRPT